MWNFPVSLEVFLKDEHSLTGGSGLPDGESVPHARPLRHLPSPNTHRLPDQQIYLLTDALLKDTCSGSVP